MEADNGDARLLPGKRTDRRNIKNNGKGGSIIRKLKSSFRKTPTNSSLDKNESSQGGDDNDLVMVAEQRMGSSARPNSPAHSTESLVTVEVGTIVDDV